MLWVSPPAHLWTCSSFLLTTTLFQTIISHLDDLDILSALPTHTLMLCSAITYSSPSTWVIMNTQVYLPALNTSEVKIRVHTLALKALCGLFPDDLSCHPTLGCLTFLNTLRPLSMLVLLP